jgi:hypothetical protein
MRRNRAPNRILHRTVFRKLSRPMWRGFYLSRVPRLSAAKCGPHTSAHATRNACLCVDGSHVVRSIAHWSRLVLSAPRRARDFVSHAPKQRRSAAVPATSAWTARGAVPNRRGEAGRFRRRCFSYRGWIDQPKSSPGKADKPNRQNPLIGGSVCLVFCPADCPRAARLSDYGRQSDRHTDTLSVPHFPATTDATNRACSALHNPS